MTRFMSKLNAVGILVTTRALPQFSTPWCKDGGSASDYCTWLYALVEAGDGQSAVTAGLEATVKHPGDGSLLFYLAHGYSLEDRFADALATIDQAISLGERPENHCLRADILLDLERFEEAIAEAEAVLDTDPEHWHSVDQIMRGLVLPGPSRGCGGPCEGARSACAIGTTRVARGREIPRLTRPTESSPGIRRQGAEHRC